MTLLALPGLDWTDVVDDMMMDGIIY